MSYDCLEHGQTEYLLNKYSDMVYRIAFMRVKNVSDAEDIMQEVFLSYVRFKPQFDSDEHEKAWFIRVTVNKSKSLLSSVWNNRTLPFDEALHGTSEESMPSPVTLAVSCLPLEMRTAVHLYYYEGLQVKEIAVSMGRSESSVKSLLSRARARLKDYLTE